MAQQWRNARFPLPCPRPPASTEWEIRVLSVPCPRLCTGGSGSVRGLARETMSWQEISRLRGAHEVCLFLFGFSQSWNNALCIERHKIKHGYANSPDNWPTRPAQPAENERHPCGPPIPSTGAPPACLLLSPVISPRGSLSGASGQCKRIFGRVIRHTLCREVLLCRGSSAEHLETLGP